MKNDKDEIVLLREIYLPLEKRKEARKRGKLAGNKLMEIWEENECVVQEVPIRTTEEGKKLQFALNVAPSLHISLSRFRKKPIVTDELANEYVDYYSKKGIKVVEYDKAKVSMTIEYLEDDAFARKVDMQNKHHARISYRPDQDNTDHAENLDLKKD